MRICWFTTGRDREALTLLKEVSDAINNRVIRGEISLLFMNRERNESPISDEIIAFVEERSIPIELISSRKFLSERGLALSEGRHLFDAEVKSRIEKYSFDIIFLAGYMLILSHVLFEPFVVLNLHPSLPSAYKGKWEDVIRMTIEDGERIFGAMIHMVEAALDEGAPITYAKLVLQGKNIDRLYKDASDGHNIAKDTLFNMMREQEFSIETPLIVKTLSLLSTGEIRIVDKRVHYMERYIKGGIDITGEI